MSKLLVILFVIKTKIALQEVQKRGKLEEASEAHHREPHIISKLLKRFALSRI